MAAPVAPGQHEAALAQGRGKALAVIRGPPAPLQHRFHIARIPAHTLCLLPFLQREIARVPVADVLEAGGHLPTMFAVEFAGNIAELELVMREVFRRHGLGIDPRPDRMGVPAAFFFMEQDDPGMALKAVAGLNALHRILKSLDRNALMLWRVERDGKQELAAARAF